MRSRSVLILCICLLIPATPSLAADHADAALRAAIHGPQRSPQHKARDRYRHPFKTLQFFGIQPDMTVVELWPGGGWYTEILAPYLHDHGQLIEAGYDPGSNSDYYRKGAARFAKKLAADPAIYGKIRMTYLDPGLPVNLAEPGTADMVLTFRNLHNWMNAGMLNRVFQAAYRALKPGGVFGVVEHRAKPGADPHLSDMKGYMPVEFVVARAKAAGFELAASSQINANPRDTKDYPKGVWTLPPTYTLGKKNRARYAAIGESDRMTLKFVKPATR